MSNDASVTQDLLQTLEDGRAGFEKGAEKLDSTDAPELAPTFRKYSEQRAAFATELQTLAQQYGDQLDADGSIAGTLHRGWLSLKDALAGLEARRRRTVVQRQLTEIRAAHDDVKALRATLT